MYRMDLNEENITRWEDNDPKFVKTEKCLRNLKFQTMKRSAQSPHVNPTGNLRSVGSRVEGEKIAVESGRILIENMPERIKRVIKRLRKFYKALNKKI